MLLASPAFSKNTSGLTGLTGLSLLSPGALPLPVRPAAGAGLCRRDRQQAAFDSQQFLPRQALLPDLPVVGMAPTQPRCVVRFKATAAKSV